MAQNYLKKENNAERLDLKFVNKRKNRELYLENGLFLIQCGYFYGGNSSFGTFVAMLPP